jgi:hypothetical protein
MGHVIVKFFSEHESGEIPKGWHLHLSLDQAEYTACGLAETEYDVRSKTVERGGITCPDCLEQIKFYKSIKL